jgi:hypothetical protein
MTVWLNVIEAEIHIIINHMYANPAGPGQLRSGVARMRGARTLKWMILR